LAGAAAAHAEVRIGLAAPFTGPYAWSGAWMERGVEAAVADLNARGGVLGEPIEVVTADDYCDGEQAVAAANALVARGVVAVFGHECSGAAIPGLEGLCRRRHLDGLDLCHQPGAHRAGFHQRVPRGWPG
jgi:ABC-type branched-subunit amino acid transport system substrate-binding protein